MTTTRPETSAYIPGGTRVLNIRDGEPGHVMSGFAYDPAAGWVEYEVETACGVERWLRCDFIPFDQLQTDERRTTMATTTKKTPAARRAARKRLEKVARAMIAELGCEAAQAHGNLDAALATTEVSVSALKRTLMRAFIAGMQLRASDPNANVDTYIDALIDGQLNA